MIKEKNIALCIIWSLVTCGLYSIYWFFCVNDDVNEMAHRDGPSSLLVILLSFITCGIYLIYWNYCMGEKLEEIRSEYGRPSGSMPVLLLVLSLFGMGLISLCIMQNDLNAVAQ